MCKNSEAHGEGEDSLSTNMGRAKGAAAVLSTAPAYTFGSGSHSFGAVNDSGPGPGAYPVKVTGSEHGNLAKGGGFGTGGRLARYGKRSTPVNASCSPKLSSTSSVHQRPSGSLSRACKLFAIFAGLRLWISSVTEHCK